MRAEELTESQIFYYHGTSVDDNARSILASGKLIPGDHTSKPTHNLTPMVNRTYITTDLSYALIYALGGDYAGNKHSIHANDDEYGYIFKIHKSNIKNRIPDEDVVGELSRDIVSGDDNHDFPDSEIKELNELVSAAFNYVIEPSEHEDATPYDRFIDHEYEFFAAIGKYILDNGSNRLIARFRLISPHHSGEGEMIIDQAWKFRKKDAAYLKRDGSNVFEYSVRVL